MKSKEGSQARAESRSRTVAQSGITQQVRRAKGQNRAGGGKVGQVWCRSLSRGSYTNIK